MMGGRYGPGQGDQQSQGQLSHSPSVPTRCVNHNYALAGGCQQVHLVGVATAYTEEPQATSVLKNFFKNKVGLYYQHLYILAVDAAPLAPRVSIGVVYRSNFRRSRA